MLSNSLCTLITNATTIMIVDITTVMNFAVVEQALMIMIHTVVHIAHQAKIPTTILIIQEIPMQS